MIIVLKHNFISENNVLLDALALKNWNNQKELAKYLEIGLSTLERRVRVLKETYSLRTFKYQGNNFIYCIGSDVKNMYDGHIALETAKFREFISEDFYINENDLKELLSEIPIFDNEEISTTKIKNFIPEPKPQQTIFPKMHLDWLAEKIAIRLEISDDILDKINEYMEANKSKFDEIFSVK